MNKFITTFITALALSACTLTPAFAERPNEVNKNLFAAVGELIVHNSVIEVKDGKEKLKTEDNFICTVSKIGPKTFLSAGHCVAESAYYTFDVKYGKQTAKVSHIIAGAKAKPGAKSDGPGIVKEDWSILVTEKDIDVPTLKLDCKNDVYVGQPIATVGFPYPANKSYFEGYVASTTPLRVSTSGSFFADITGAPGSSGSPVVDKATNEVVGILVIGIYGMHREAFLVGMQDVKVQGICFGR